ncbi:hypothetical protein D7Y13_12655 [Corallococcus praedator]|uniref:HTH iclR-type domain-containing protein n=1 Tax=Corallococcus praedator TaxID=2316724 RepID=A0ABX9QJN1_9BACT|nr:MULTISPECIES: hypothetical protein [Corallococcus]RKH32549.1 hypothetical protein D7X75_15345 [Corallococcus sp. CA031C]RKI10484.1 hypothetical protein D7Y13_12655 [Corallococcus praedator]
MKRENSNFREEFWKNPPPLPRGVELVRQEAVVVPRVGPGGESIYDLAEIRLPEARVPVLMGYRAPLFPVDVLNQRKKLHVLSDHLRQRDSNARSLPSFRMPMLVTDSASSNVIEACEREELALVDQRGTFFLRTGSTFIRVQGREPTKRSPREPLFHGKGCRIVRVLLQSPAKRWTILALAQMTQTSYAYAHGVIKRLVVEGYVHGGYAQGSRSAGFHLREPVPLLNAWLESGRPTAVSREGFNAPSTTPEQLHRGHSLLASQGIRSIFTLASALLPDERFVSGLPHGLYLSGSLEAGISAFGLRRMTPHNFWVLRAEAAAETEVGGVYHAPRSLPHGPGVALPQLAVDFQRSGGRGPEQAEELVRRFAQALPLSDEPS